MIAEGVELHGRYRLDRRIGQGRFARVYLGADLLLGRPVAIKVLHEGLTGLSGERDFLTRFANEAKVVATLDHPHILTVFDYGRIDDTAYLVMPHIAGGSLDDKLGREKQLSVRQASAYLDQIAAALDYAHRQGIIHRDINPHNMLLDDSDRHLLLADFGLAKVLSAGGVRSHTGALGTVAYMAPEQFDGRVSPATDLYALGCVLFAMLAGEPPYSGPPEQVMRGHLMSPVPTLAERRREATPDAVQRVLDRALAKDPAARFRTAAGLAEAFRAAAGGEGAAPASPAPPVATRAGGRGLDGPGDGSGAGDRWTMVTDRIRPPSAPRERRMALAGGVVAPLVLALVIAAGALIWPGAPPAPSGHVTPTVLVRTLGTVTPAPAPAAIDQRTPAPPTGAPPARPAHTPTPPAATIQPTPAPLAGAPTAGPTPVSAPPPAPPTVVPTGAPPLLGRPVATLSAGTASLWQVAWSADGRTVAAGTEEGSVLLWGPEGEARATLTGHSAPVRTLAWAPDGQTLASGSYDGTVRLWGVDDGPRRTLTDHSSPVTHLAWSPDGQRLAAAAIDGDVWLWDAAGATVAPLRGPVGAVEVVAWSPDGRWLAAGGQDGAVYLWDAAGAPIAALDGHADTVWSIAWSPDGQTVASASSDRTVRLWSRDGRPLATLTGHTDLVTKVAWSPDGAILASSSWDRTVRLWRAGGAALATLAGHTDRVYALAWSPTGRGLASAGKDGTVRLWGPQGRLVATLAGHTDTIWHLAWSPDGATLASAAADGTGRLWR